MKQLKKHIAINFTVYIFVWLITMFVHWEIINPFQWVFYIPTWEPVKRGLVLFLYAFFQYAIFIITLTTNNKDETKTN